MPVERNVTQSVTVEASLSVTDREVPDSFSELAVTEAEIKRVYGGGGSQATVKVIFDELLTPAEREQLDSFVQSGPRDDSFVEYDSPAGRRANQLMLEVGIRTTLFFNGNVREQTRTLFTGAVTKVTQNNKGVVTFNALDLRHELNRTMVQLDIAEPTPVETVVERILNNANNTGLQLSPDQYNINVADSQATTDDYFSLSAGSAGPSSSTLVNNLTYGIDAHATTFEVLQDLARRAGATIHIDTENHLHFTQYPEHKRFTATSLPPIVEWDNGDSESKNDVVVNSAYDETGTGIYAQMSQTATSDQSNTVPPGKLTKELNVFDRQAVENVRDSEIMTNELTQNSGKVRLVGDPNIQPYDTLEIDSNIVDGFAPISTGSYMAKTVRHIINNDDGYMVEIELGTDPKELFNQFTAQSTNQFRQAQQRAQKRAEEAGGFWSLIPTINVNSEGEIESIG